jgi:V8-like Glu-specific endopeptidase
VRIESINADGSAGIGTGFIFNYKINNKEAPFIVTNKHVIANTKSNQIIFIKKENNAPKLGHNVTITIQDPTSIWYGHPHNDVDVCIAALGPTMNELVNTTNQVYYKSVPNSLVPTDQQLSELDAIEQVVFIGYPQGLWDSTNLTPIIRRGVTATPVVLDYDGKKQFLIDASVFPGSSGSPVFLYNVGMYSKKDGSTVMGTRVYLLGIISGVFHENQQNEIKIADVPTTKIPLSITKQMIDLGIVFKSNTIIETVDDFIKTKNLEDKFK